VTFTLGGCRSSILHKDGMKEAVTTPIVQSIDKLELKKLVDATTKTVDKLNEVIDSSKEAIPDIKEVAKNLKELTAKLNEVAGEVKGSTKESLLWRILPNAVIGLALLIGGFIIARSIKK
jgi:phage-related minor tail protein